MLKMQHVTTIHGKPKAQRTCQAKGVKAAGENYASMQLPPEDTTPFFYDRRLRWNAHFTLNPLNHNKSTLPKPNEKHP